MTSLPNSQTKSDGFRYHALLVGGVATKNKRTIYKRLEQNSIKVVEQWAPGSGGYGFILAKKTIPNHCDLVIFLSGFLGHSAQAYVEHLAVKGKVKTIVLPFATSKWPAIFKVTGIDTTPVQKTSAVKVMECEYCSKPSVRLGLCDEHWQTHMMPPLTPDLAKQQPREPDPKPEEPSKRGYNRVSTMVKVVMESKSSEFIDIVTDIGTTEPMPMGKFVDRMWSALIYRNVFDKMLTKAAVEKLIKHQAVSKVIENVIPVHRFGPKLTRYGVGAATKPEKKSTKPKSNNPGPVFDPTTPINQLNQADVDLDAMLQLVQDQVASVKHVINNLRKLIEAK